MTDVVLDDLPFERWPTTALSVYVQQTGNAQAAAVLANRQ